MATQSPASSGFDAAAAAAYLRKRWETVQAAATDPSLLKSGASQPRRLMLRVPGLMCNDRTARGADGQAAGRRRLVGRVAGHGQARRQ